MKKLITLLFGSMIAVAAFAQARQAQVTVHAPTNMEVRIDGINYTNGNNPTIPNLPQGNHTLEVYEIKSKGILGIGKKTELVSSRNFTLGDRDVVITVDQYGQAKISGEAGSSSTRQNRGRTDNTWGKGKNKDKSHDDDDDAYRDEKDKKAKKAKKSNGKGKKLGHYKNGKL